MNLTKSTLTDSLTCWNMPFHPLEPAGSESHSNRLKDRSAKGGIQGLNKGIKRHTIFSQKPVMKRHVVGFRTILLKLTSQTFLQNIIHPVDLLA